MKKILKIVLWVVGIVLALLILVSLLAGPIAKKYVNGHGEQLTGRRVQVDHVGLNLLSGSVKVLGLQVYEEDGNHVFAGFDTLSVRARLLQLPFKTVNLQHITLTGLHADILQQGNRFNFSSLLEHFASEDEEKDTTPSDWTLKFYNIRLSHASLRYRDLQGNKELHLPDINLRVPGFVMGGQERTEGGLNLAFDKGGRLSADANYHAESGDIDATVDLTDFSLRNVEGYVRDVIDLKSVDGNLTAHLSLKGNTGALLKSHVAATVTLADVDLCDRNTQVAGLTELRVKVNDINLDNNSTLIQLQMQEQQIERTVKMTKYHYIPTLAASFSYNYMAMGDDFKFKWYPYSVVGLSLNIPIFDGFSTSSNIRQYKAAKNIMQLNREDTERNLKITLKNYENQITTCMKNYAAAESTVEVAQRSYDIAERMYELGKATLLELNDAMIGLVQAQLTMSQAVYSFMVTKSSIEELEGNDYTSK